MNEQKSLLLEIAEVIDRRLPRRSAQQDVASRRGGLRRFVRWLTPNGGTLLLVAVLILTQRVWARPLLGPASAPGPSATTVNYQGRLADSSGDPLDGTYGMSFSLWDASSGGNLMWGPESHSAVPVSDGLFSVGLGSQTSGGIPTSTWNGDRYLEITVRGETLSPRELIRSVPIAGMALTVPGGAIETEQIADGATTQVVLAQSSTEVSNNTGSLEDMPDMVAAITTEGGPVLIYFFTHYERSVAGGAGVVFRLKIDGTDVTDSTATHRVVVADQAHYASLTYATELTPGTHTIRVRWAMSHVNSTGTLSTVATRQLAVIEFKR